MGSKSVVLQVSPSKINFRMKITFVLDSVGLHYLARLPKVRKEVGNQRRTKREKRKRCYLIRVELMITNPRLTKTDGVTRPQLK